MPMNAHFEEVAPPPIAAAIVRRALKLGAGGAASR